MPVLHGAGKLLDKHIFFEGKINEERPDYFATSQVFCYPATKASFGITLLEAMSAGVPVVACNNRGFRDIIQDGVNGLLPRPDDPTALADALVRVLENKALAATLIQNGKKTADSFSWSRVTEQVLAFYNQIYLKKKGVPFAI